jgi:hypothetical protein
MNNPISLTKDISQRRIIVGVTVGLKHMLSRFPAARVMKLA